MATAKKKQVNQKAIIDTLKSIAIGAGGVVASGMVSKIIDTKLLKLDPAATGIKTALSGVLCLGVGTVGALKAKENWQKDFSKGFAVGGAYKTLKKAVPKFNLAGLEGGGYYDQYGNYVNGIDSADDEMGLAPMSSITNYPERNDWNGGDAHYSPELPIMSGIQAPENSNGYYNDGSSIVPALLGIDEIL